ncbi:hypothetical protein QTH97_30740 [Variovorax sp. J22R24]|uniref:hypothetical protein n=1 Tax=Variovorax gracilis TaxID=3053502 RepID=UPI002578AA9A|nr:hypothetical protein [Variovorax sp. J22R24]MDM0109342.1 hypothetical protein [Variovorax sp. J22R24]
METNSPNFQADGAETRNDSGTDAGRSAMDSNTFAQADSPRSDQADRAGFADEASMRKDTQGGSTLRAAAEATQGYLQDAKNKASAAAETGKAYAQSAVNAAGKKINDVKDQAADLKQRGMEYAAQEPMKAVAIAAAGSAVVTALLMTLMRARR